MPEKVRAKQEAAGRCGLCLRTKFGGDALEGVADGVDGMVVSVRVAADPLAGTGLFILIGAELFIRFRRAVFVVFPQPLPRSGEPSPLPHLRKRTSGT